MGTSAGTGVRSFAEGGSTSSTDSSNGLGSTPQAGYLTSYLNMQQPGTFAPPQAQYLASYPGMQQFGTFTPPQAIQEAMRQAQRDAATVQNMRFVDKSAGSGSPPQYKNFYGYLPRATRTPPSTTASYAIPYRTQSQIEDDNKFKFSFDRDAAEYTFYEDSLMRQNPEYWENQGIRPDSHSVMAHMAAMNQG